MSNLTRRDMLHGGVAGLATAMAGGLARGQTKPADALPPEAAAASVAPRGVPVDVSTRTLEQIAAFAHRVRDDDLDGDSALLVKRNLLDSLGCAIGAIGHGPVEAVRKLNDEFGGRGLCTQIGGGKTSPDRAALYNGCLVRYLDFMDCFHVKKEVCHPCDTIAGLIAVAEYAEASGRALLTAIAVAYQIHCRLLEELGAMRAGLNHTTPQAVAVAAAAARLLKLDVQQTQSAIALALDTGLSMSVTQAEPISQWKGLSSGHANMAAVHQTFMARSGVTGPAGAFDGPFGLYQLIRSKAQLNWDQEGLDVIRRTSLKRYNAEFHAQPIIEATLELKRQHNLGPTTPVQQITVDVFREAYEVIGGGAYGPKNVVKTKESADHNILYVVAVALLDGDVGPAQYADERIGRADVQTLLQKVIVRPSNDYSQHYPEQTPVRVTVRTSDGQTFTQEKRDWHGYAGRPMSFDDVVAKFDRIAAPNADASARQAVVAAVYDLDRSSTADLAAALTLGR